MAYERELQRMRRALETYRRLAEESRGAWRAKFQYTVRDLERRIATYQKRYAATVDRVVRATETVRNVTVDRTRELLRRSAEQQRRSAESIRHVSYRYVTDATGTVRDVTREVTETVRRDIKKALKIFNEIPEDTPEKLMADQVFASLWKLYSAVEEGWIEPEVLERKLPRKFER